MDAKKAAIDVDTAKYGCNIQHDCFLHYIKNVSVRPLLTASFMEGSASIPPPPPHTHCNTGCTSDVWHSVWKLSLFEQRICIEKCYIPFGNEEICVYVSFFQLASTVLICGPWPSLMDFSIHRHVVGLLSWGISPTQGLYQHAGQHNTETRRHTSMPRAGFEPAIS
jgi:hypothetical protein